MRIFTLASCLSLLCYSSVSACEDQYPDGCRQKKESCFSSDESDVKTMHEACPKTCGLCNKIVSAPIQPFPAIPAATTGARLSLWSEWSACPSESCEGNSRRRIRQCMYEDARLAPSNLCNGVENQEEQCACARGSSKQDSTVLSNSLCKDGSSMCSTFTSLCDSSGIFKSNLCPLTCKQCKKNEPLPDNPGDKKGVCKDRYASCKHGEIKDLCKNPSHINDLSAYCPVTCGLCEKRSTPTKDRAVCEDKYPEGCRQQKLSCSDENAEVRKDMRRLCPITCRSCNEIEPLATDTVFPIPVETTVPPAAAECRNKYPGCEEQKSKCTSGDASEIKAMRQLCPETCGTCGKLGVVGSGPVTPTALKATLSSPIAVCADKYQGCAEQKSSCTSANKESRETMHMACPMTCGICGLSGPITPATAAPAPIVPAVAGCADKYPGCAEQKSACMSGNKESRETMHTACPVTCGTCGLAGALNPVTVAPVVPTVAACKNQYPGCQEQKTTCTTGDEESKKTMRRLCPVTCGTCGLPETLLPATVAPTAFELTLSTLAACRNKDPGCEQYKPSCTDSNLQIKETVRQLCPVTCGTCGRSGILAPTPTTLESTLSNLEGCKDKDPNCEKFKSSCNTGSDESKELMRNTCPLTCGTCRPSQSGTSTSPTVTPKALIFTVSAPTVCRNIDSNCNQLKSSCDGDERSKEIMRQTCPVTCGMCKPSAALTPATAAPAIIFEPTSRACKDSFPRCSKQISSCTTGEKKIVETMRRLCPVTCNSCGEAISQVPATLSPTALETISVAGQSSCVNQLDDVTCQKYRHLCDEESNDWVKYCRLTCGKCDQGTAVQASNNILQGLPTPTIATQTPATPSTQCGDYLKECPDHPDLCDVPGSGWLKACLVTCGVC